jgi:RNA polymerase sigma-70 factor (ECF subfamily)
MGESSVVQRGGGATIAPANDTGDDGGVTLVERKLASLIAGQYRWMIQYSRRLTANGPEAADLVHIVCTRILSQQIPIGAVANLSSWLRTVLFHTFIDLRRRAQREIPTESAALDRWAVAPPEEIEEPHVTMDDLRALLSGLPAHYRVPYVMFTFDGVPYAQIATILGVSLTTVGTRINRARERLRRMIRARSGA